MRLKRGQARPRAEMGRHSDDGDGDRGGGWPIDLDLRPWLPFLKQGMSIDSAESEAADGRAAGAILGTRQGRGAVRTRNGPCS